MSELLFRDDPYLGAELDARPELAKTMSAAPPRGEIGKLAVARIRSEGKRNKRVTLVFA